MSYTMTDLQFQVKDLFESDGYVVPDEMIEGICRVMVAVRNTMTRPDGSQSKEMLVTANTLRAAFVGNINASNDARSAAPNRLQTLSLRPSGTLFKRLDDALMEIYGIKMLPPELWSSPHYMFVDLLEAERTCWRTSRAKFFEALLTDVPRPVEYEDKDKLDS